MGQFQPTWESGALIAIVDEVARHADPAHPAKVSQRAYNAARAPAGRAGTPRADRIAARFGVSWSILLDRVLNSADPERMLPLADRTRVRQVLTPAEAQTALTQAAGWLGVESLDILDYERARLGLLEHAERAHIHGRHLVPLPSALNLERVQDFERVRAAAGVGPPARRNWVPMSRDAAIVLFIEHCGFVPERAQIAWFAKQHGFSIVAQKRERHTIVMARVHQRWIEQGRWWPKIKRTYPLPWGWQEVAALDSPAIAAAREAHPAKRRDGPTLEEVTADIHRALDLLPSDLRLTSERYRMLVRDHGLVARSVAQRATKRHGLKWTELVRQVARSRA